MAYSFRNLLTISLLVSLFMSFPSISEAKIPIPVGFGEQISMVYDLPNDKFEGKDLGYMYNSFRILFIPIISWGGKFVIFEGNTYGDLSKENLDLLEKTYGKMSRRVGLWIRYGNYVMLLLFAVVGIIFAKVQLSE